MPFLFTNSCDLQYLKVFQLMCTCYHTDLCHWQGSQVHSSTCQGTHVLSLRTGSTSLALIANIIWQLFAKKVNHGPHPFFSILQCLFDEWLNKSRENFTKIQVFICNGLLMITWNQRYDLVSNDVNWLLHNVHQVVWDSLMDYDRIEWQRTLKGLAKAPDVAYEDVLKECDSFYDVLMTLSPTKYYNGYMDD